MNAANVSTGHGRTPRALGYRRGAKALVTRQDTVLLVKEQHSDGTSFWTLPGGGIEADETATEGLRRELREELGCESRMGDRLGQCVYAHVSSTVVTVYEMFACDIEHTPDPDITEGIFGCAWVSLEGVPTRTLPQVRAVVDSVL